MLRLIGCWLLLPFWVIQCYINNITGKEDDYWQENP